MLGQLQKSKNFVYDHLSPIECRHIIKEYQKVAPIKISDIAHALGISVQTSRLPVGISGKLFYDPSEGTKSGYVIEVSNREIIQRQRFTVAYEIAHFILHKEEIGNSVAHDSFYRSDLSSKLEDEAKKLAGDILMPWHLITEVVNSQSENMTVEMLANHFNVTVTAMSVRLGSPT